MIILRLIRLRRHESQNGDDYQGHQIVEREKDSYLMITVPVLLQVLYYLTDTKM